MKPYLCWNRDNDVVSDEIDAASPMSAAIAFHARHGLNPSTRVAVDDRRTGAVATFMVSAREDGYHAAPDLQFEGT